MQSLRSLSLARFATRKPYLARSFSVSLTAREQKAQDFPWLLCQDKPRIPKYPYESAPQDWSFLNLLPVGLQHVLAQWLGNRILQLNTGSEYFPDQFLVGASLASRRALELLSQELSQPNEETKQELENMLGPDLLDRFVKAAPAETNISIGLPQVYDVNLNDIWISLGNPRAFSDSDKYDVLRWMTVQVGLSKAKLPDEEESFQDYRERVAKSILEGVQVGVDVHIDADVTFQIKKDKDVLIYDQGRRILRMRFATPYFEPASKMVSGRDEETGEPINNWSWRLVDIDQLLEKEAMEQDS